MKLFKSSLLLSSLLLISCSNFEHYLDVVSIDIKVNESFYSQIYPHRDKNEFNVFDSKESIIAHFNNGNYVLDDLATQEIDNTFTDDLFEKYYVVLLHTTIGTSESIKAAQKDNLIIYHIYVPSTMLDAFTFITLLNLFNKDNYKVNEIKYTFTYSY